MAIVNSEKGRIIVIIYDTIMRILEWNISIILNISETSI